DGTSGRPVAGVLVAISSAPGTLASLAPGDTVPLEQLMSVNLGSVMSGVRQAITDGQGRFAFTGLSSGSFAVTVTKPGWTGGGFGQRRPDGAPAVLVLRENERLANLSLPLWKNAAIGGTVLDEANEPIVGLQVRVLRRTWLAGHARYTTGGAAQT